MKVYISVDAEGVAGITDWRQITEWTDEHRLRQSLVVEEVNAAIDGGAEGGATEFVVNDGHWAMRNLPPEELHRHASYLSGRYKPLYMMEGLDATYDAVFFLGYHASVGAEIANLCHTYNPFVLYEVRLNGVPVGESGINALVALAHRVPVVLVSGDNATIREAAVFMPNITGVVVKRSVSRYAAESLHPERARELIRVGAKKAVAGAPTAGVPVIDLPARLELDTLTADMAEIATWVGGVERIGTRSVAIESDDPLALYRTFVAVDMLTTSLTETPR